MAVVRMSRVFALLNDATDPPDGQVASWNDTTKTYEPRAPGGGAMVPHDIQGAFHTGSGLTAGHVLRASAPTAFSFAAIQDGDLPASIARDSEVSAAISAHEAAGDPHPTYTTAAEASAAAAAAVAAHEGAADPHAGYQKESEKGAANGYASLGAGTLVPIAQLATGTPTGTKFIRDDQTLAVPPDTGITQLTSDVTAGPGSGSQAATIAAGVVTNAKLAQMVQATIKGRASGAGTGDPTDLTSAQATAILDAFTSALKGLVPASGGGTSNFLRADGSWSPAGGSGADPPEGSYAPGSYTIATGKFRVAAKRQQFTGAQRLTIAGTGRLSLGN